MKDLMNYLNKQTTEAVKAAKALFIGKSVIVQYRVREQPGIIQNVRVTPLGDMYYEVKVSGYDGVVEYRAEDMKVLS